MGREQDTVGGIAVIQAIETRYAGYRFRSRLEARWAVFFDNFGAGIREVARWDDYEKEAHQHFNLEPPNHSVGAIHYDYEKDGFRLMDGSMYLPDFWLPEFKLWVEVKPPEDAKGETTCSAFRDSDIGPILLCCGYPHEYTGTLFCWESSESGGGPSEFEAAFAYFSVGGPTLAILEGYRSSRRLHSDCYFEHTLPRYRFTEPCNYYSPIEATRISKQARFEHGETP